jgi:hypothetical protein
VLNGDPLQDIHQNGNMAYGKGGRMYSADTLDEVWPNQEPYGHFFWEMDEARSNDVKIIK